MWFGLHRHTWVDVTSAMALNITNRLTKYKLLDNQSRTLAGEAMKSTNVRKRQRKRCTIWQICSVSFVARMESSQIRPRSTFVLWLAWPSCLRKHINVRKPCNECTTSNSNMIDPYQIHPFCPTERVFEVYTKYTTSNVRTRFLPGRQCRPVAE